MDRPSSVETPAQETNWHTKVVLPFKRKKGTSYIFTIKSFRDENNRRIRSIIITYGSKMTVHVKKTTIRAKNGFFNIICAIIIATSHKRKTKTEIHPSRMRDSKKGCALFLKASLLKKGFSANWFTTPTYGTVIQNVNYKE